MARWKKMAEAFGRAMNERMKDGKTAKIINSSEIADKANTPGIYKDKDMDAIQAYRRGQNEGTENFYAGRERAVENAASNMDPTAKRIYDNYDFDYERAYGPDDAYNRAVKLSGVEDAPSSPFEFEERFGFDITESPRPRKSDISRNISSVEDENSSRRLQDEFDKAFDEAVTRRNYNTDYDKADRLFTGRRANESMERFDEMFPDHWKATDEEREPMMRKFMIEELKRGTPIEDVIYLPSELRRAK